jgi:hypothetical protein
MTTANLSRVVPNIGSIGNMYVVHLLPLKSWTAREGLTWALHMYHRFVPTCAFAFHPPISARNSTRMIPRIHSSRTRESAQRSNFQNICTEHLNMEKKNICQVHCGGNKYRSERRARRPRRRRRRTQGDGLARTKRRQGVMRSARDRTVQATEPAAFSPLAIMLPAGGAFSVFS